ncbi:MAG: HNH endonuclease [Oscillospiraceae bacterium]|nr:HNH endonuclease [Oscillospiraceae bacterium]
MSEYYTLTAIAFILLFIAFIIVGLCYFVDKERKEKQRGLVKQTSSKCHDLFLINKRYSFHELEKEYTLSKFVNSKSQFDHFDSFGFLVDDISKNLFWAESLLKKASENRKWSKEYWAEVKQIKNTADVVIQSCGMSVPRYTKIEDELFNKLLLSHSTDVSIHVVVIYITPKGRHHYRNEAVYDEHDIRAAIDKAKNREQKKAERKDQRSLMTPTLRYKILQRDGFRCVLCGASRNDGAILEVDHIIPVSKGGLTTESNLRTLCRECNRGKSDKYDPYGFN